MFMQLQDLRGSDSKAVPKQNPSTSAGAPTHRPSLKVPTRSFHLCFSHAALACAHVIPAAHLEGGGASGGRPHSAAHDGGRIPALAAAATARDVWKNIRRLHTDTRAVLLLLLLLSSRPLQSLPPTRARRVVP